MPDNPKVTLKDVSHSYDRFRYLFKNINTVISPSSPLAIVGSNGSGKSTLLKIILGLLTASSGNIEYNNIHNKALVAPYFNLYDELTLKQHHKLFNSVIKSDILKYWKMENALDYKVSEYSSGMKQRAKFILSELIQKPNSIIAWDEPFANIDKDGIERVIMRREELINSGACVVIASNDTKEYEGIENSIKI
ncbi:MAG: ABC transporter ATP-binding protein [Candidatus Kapaibacteriales bacterium]